MFSQVEDGDDVGMRAEPAHGLRLAGYTGTGDFVQALRLDEGESHIPVKQLVMCQLDLFLAALSQEPLHLVTAVSE